MKKSFIALGPVLDLCCSHISRRLFSHDVIHRFIDVEKILQRLVAPEAKLNVLRRGKINIFGFPNILGKSFSRRHIEIFFPESRF